MLALEPIAFDDIEGPLVYVHMLLLLAQDREIQGIDRATVGGWKEKYLDVFNTTLEMPEEGYKSQRREVINREFDSLVAKLPL